MDKEFARKALIVAAILLLLPFSLAWALNRSEYEGEKSRIGEVYNVDRIGCDALEHGTRLVCIAQAKLRQKVALAELEHAFTGMASDRMQVLRARAELDYLQAHQPCESQTAGAASPCLMTARADLEKS